ncbi:MAG TPA: sigma-70 family RNA polymerase sigma factor [Gammaproteobacteria bacterium]|nr:sigma-70 family RNA polymerase sigma factor [Gammaproteobacteria bacterium]
MNCEHTAALLADRLKGLSSVEDERRLEEHLATCAACREEARSMEALWEDLGTLDAEVPHERMRARFHAALAAYEERSAGNALEQWLERWWPRRPLLQAGLAAATLVIGVLVGERLALPRSGEIDALRDDIRVVGLALLELPVERREVLVLSRYEFKTYEEIASALGCSVGAVKVRAHRAIKQLREIYLDLAEEASA